MSFGDAANLLGEVLTFGIVFKALNNINGTPHQLEEVHNTKADADDHVKRLKKRGKKARIVKKTKNGKAKYAVYSKVEKPKKAKKK